MIVSVSDWQRLSVRLGRAAEDGPFEGVPAHLRVGIDRWIRVSLSRLIGRNWVADVPTITRVGARCRLALVAGNPDYLRDQVLEACDHDPDVCFEVVDAILHVKSNVDVTALQEILEDGCSAWTVPSNGQEIQRRVDQAAVAAFNEAKAPADLASDELEQAWSKAYGLNHDASDAWDHAIKAVEAVLAPVVVPKQSSPQIGHVLGQLRTQPERWRLVLPGPNQDHGVEPVVTMLQTLWPNPDRHSAGNPRTPTIEEARAIVHLAVLLVQWARASALTLKP